MYAHERSLVQKMQGKPFVLLGLNGDPSRQKAREVMVRDNINWRSFWLGGPDSPVVGQYGVTSWPSTFLVDGQGIVRARDLRGAELEQVIDTLVREAEKKSLGAERGPQH